MKHPGTRKEGTRGKGVGKPRLGFHPPFTEFRAARLEDLLRLLDWVRPRGWKVEVSSLEDTQHIACGGALTHVLVYSGEGEPGPGSVHVIYQYCPACRIAVRVL